MADVGEDVDDVDDEDADDDDAQTDDGDEAHLLHGGSLFLVLHLDHLHGQLALDDQQQVHVQRHVVEPPLGQVDAAVAAHVVLSNLSSHPSKIIQKFSVSLGENKPKFMHFLKPTFSD